MLSFLKHGSKAECSLLANLPFASFAINHPQVISPCSPQPARCKRCNLSAVHFRKMKRIARSLIFSPLSARTCRRDVR
jgi:hypothetical protein